MRVIQMNLMLKKYEVTQCALYKCSNQRRLEDLLTLQKYDLNKIKGVLSYHSFSIDKKGTDEKRKITAPDTTLKQIQSRILSLIQKVIRPEWLISGEKGKCYIDNGRSHLLSNYVLTIDIKKFYDNCKRDSVFRFFSSYLKTSGDVAGILTDIVTYSQGIPTGCPTSQLIAYYANQDMFEEINSIAKKYCCKFTLYVDDMTFSNTDPFEHKKMSYEIDRVLRKYGHKPKYKKIKFYPKKSPKPITGTIVTPNHQLDAPNNLQKKVYDNFQEITDINASDRCSPEQEKTLLTLRGQLQAVRNINPNKFPEINRLLKLMPTVSTTPRSLQRTHSYAKIKIQNAKR